MVLGSGGARHVLMPCTLLAFLFVIFCPQHSTAQAIPRYEVDALWPKLPLPDGWVTGGLGGTCIDNQDHVFILTVRRELFMLRSRKVEEFRSSRSLGPDNW
jgi:hypothetical protein